VIRLLLVASAFAVGLTLSLLALRDYLGFDLFVGRLGNWIF
jgi:hypothetical protein